MNRFLSITLVLLVGLTLLGCDPPYDDEGDIVALAGDEVTVEVNSESILGATCKLENCEIEFDPNDVDFNNVGEYMIYYEAYVDGEYEKYRRQYVDVVDTTPPVCSPLEHKEYTLGEEVDFPEPECEDNYSFVEIIPDEHIDMTTPGEYYIDYICKDTSGNETLIVFEFSLIKEETIVANPIEPINGAFHSYVMEEVETNSDDYSIYHLMNNMHIAGEDIATMDIDSDGDDDVIYFDGSTRSMIAYLRNDGNIFSQFFIDEIVSTGFFEFFDLDSDGKDEFMISSFVDDGFYIYKNIDSEFTKQFLKTEGEHPRRIVSLDIDLDGDEDIIHFEWYQDSIAVYGNENGVLELREYFSSASSTEYTQSAEIAKFDHGSDGDMDLIVSNADHNLTGKIFLIENDNGSLNEILIDEQTARNPKLADLDHDGDLDLIVVAGSRMVYTYENVEGTFTNKSLIFDDMYQAMSIQLIEENDTIELVIPERDSVVILKDVTLTTCNAVKVNHTTDIHKGLSTLLDVDSDGDLDVLYTTIFDAYVLIR